MIKTFLNSYKVSFAEGGNQIIYFLKRLPLIGKKIPDCLYKETSIKIFLGTISEVLGLVGGILGKAIYLGLMIILPGFLYLKYCPNLLHMSHLSKTVQWQTHIFPIFLHMLFFLSFIFGSLFNTIVFNTNKQSFSMIVLMRADPRKYYVSKIIYTRFINLIHFIIPMIILGLIMKISPRMAGLLTLYLIIFKVIGEAFEIFFYEKTNTILLDNKIFTYSSIILLLFGAYVLPLRGLIVPIKPIIFNPLVGITIILLGILSFVYIYNYKNYKSISSKLLDRQKFFQREALMGDMKFIDVKIDEKKMKAEDLNTTKYNNKSGYEYLNALFFLRHRKILINPIKERVIIIFIAFLVMMYFVLFTSGKTKIINTLYKEPGTMVFLMYFMSTGERICRALFHNCDVGLLRYSYYRESKAVLHNFSLRLKKAVLLNLIPALAVCFTILAIILAGGIRGERIIGIVPILICIICLSCFFSIHHLFMYYVIQPYTAQLTVKSPLFSFVQGAMYFVCYACLKIKVASVGFTFGVIGATLIYMVIALIVIYRVAPRTFRLK